MPGLDVVDRGAEDALEVDAAVLVEAPSSMSTVAFLSHGEISALVTGVRFCGEGILYRSWPLAA